MDLLSILETAIEDGCLSCMHHILMGKDALWFGRVNHVHNTCSETLWNRLFSYVESIRFKT